ncbi:MAG: hypothetical protein N2050_05995 [Flavobacteriales bacterium]|nr:hypothetical protein [Flavobacteriales bacterium]
MNEAIQFAISEGSNTIALDWAVNFNDDGSIVPVEDPASLHPFWSDISKIVAKAKASGLKIILKPHTTLSNSGWNRNIWNTDINTFLPENFFPAYTSYLENLAVFAEENKVEALCFGTEMNHLDWRFREYWESLIQAVRNKFSGLVLYDALFNRNYYSVQDVEEVVFWDLVDYIGISLYVPLTTDDNADISTLKAAWTSDLQGWFEIDNVITYLSNISQQYGKQIIALESGYPSITGGLFLVNSSPSEDKYAHFQLQYNGLEAYFDILKDFRSSWFKGLTLWEITPYMLRPEGLNSIYHQQGFSVYQKPAAQVVKKYFYKQY